MLILKKFIHNNYYFFFPRQGGPVTPTLTLSRAAPMTRESTVQGKEKVKKRYDVNNLGDTITQIKEESLKKKYWEGSSNNFNMDK